MKRGLLFHLALLTRSELWTLQNRGRLNSNGHFGAARFTPLAALSHSFVDRTARFHALGIPTGAWNARTFVNLSKKENSGPTNKHKSLKVLSFTEVFRIFLA